MESTQTLVTQLKTALFSDLRADEELNINFFGEDSTFVRFNNAQIRQNTHVEQRQLEAELHCKQKSFKFSLSLTGNLDQDRDECRKQLQLAQNICRELPDDPFFVPFENRGTSKEIFPGSLPSLTDALRQVPEIAAGNDLAGILSTGPIFIANENSKGQSHFFATKCFQLDYSLFHGEKAVKSLYAGKTWSESDLRTSLQASAEKLKLLTLPECTVKLGSYRTYLAPAAVNNLIGMLSWNGLSHSAYKRGQSYLQKLFDKELQLHKDFHLSEDFSLGGSPRFNSLGEVSAVKVELFRAGQIQSGLVSSRTAKEFQATSNAADPSESQRSAAMAPGSLKEEEILQRLGTGLYLSNLHYLNWSDRMGARVTGMTRYACFWVENGKIQGPIKNLRFDESIYRVFGSELEAITEKREFIPDTSTYERRQVSTVFMPGILVKDFRFTL